MALYCKYIEKSQRGVNHESGLYVRNYVILKWKGNYTKDGVIKGYFSFYDSRWTYNDKMTIPSTYNDSKGYEKGTIEGKIKGDKIFITKYYTQEKSYNNHQEYMNDQHGLYKVTGKWELTHLLIKKIKETYVLDILSEISSQTDTQT
ncbi:hypothetical protein, partial [Sulfurovum sp.]|uniref:hypothetical protein n=1 Tax=Sulfurovum sp. TaxID=1969726 RepID=UPI0026002A23